MSDLLAARSQMALSLAFHILFAVVGMAMPLLMVLAEGRWIRTGDPGWRDLAVRWSKGTAVLFAVGAVSGTVLSFELGLLWPEFMRHAGPLVGMPFSLEGFAFFLEAIFLGVVLYGWDRVPPRVHQLAGVGVLVSGVCSAVFVVAANAFMNAPVGFRVSGDGDALALVDIDVWAAFRSPAFFTEALHMVIAAFVVVGWSVAGVHAWRLLGGGGELDRRALTLALWVAGVASLVQPLSGDLSAQHVARHQPVKLAAMEAHWDTETCAPLRIGGWPDEVEEVTRWSLEVPCGLSLLAFHDPRAEVMGLKDVPPEDRPPVAITHVAFQLMVGIGTALAGLSAVVGWRAWRTGRLPENPWILRAIVLAGPLSLVALEAGWTVTEVGRQPWVIHGVLRTADAVTPMPGLVVPFTVFTILYLFLGVTVVGLLRRIVFSEVSDAR